MRQIFTQEFTVVIGSFTKTRFPKDCPRILVNFEAAHKGGFFSRRCCLLVKSPIIENILLSPLFFFSKLKSSGTVKCYLTAIIQPFYSHQKFTDSHRTVIRQASDKHQTVIRQSSDSHQTVIRQSSKNY